MVQELQHHHELCPHTAVIGNPESNRPLSPRRPQEDLAPSVWRWSSYVTLLRLKCQEGARLSWPLKLSSPVLFSPCLSCLVFFFFFVLICMFNIGCASMVCVLLHLCVLSIKLDQNSKKILVRTKPDEWHNYSGPLKRDIVTVPVIQVCADRCDNGVRKVVLQFAGFIWRQFWPNLKSNTSLQMSFHQLNADSFIVKIIQEMIQYRSFKVRQCIGVWLDWSVMMGVRQVVFVGFVWSRLWPDVKAKYIVGKVF